jgi:hypothetical protein
VEQFSKEPKRGTIQFFSSSRTTKSQKSNNSLISREITACQTVQIDSTFLTSQQQQVSSHSSISPRLLSPLSIKQQQQEQISSPSLESPRLLPSSSSEQQEVQVALSPSESCLSLSSSSNKPASNTGDTLLCLSIYEREN